jgi:hypothetical protein
LDKDGGGEASGWGASVALDVAIDASAAGAAKGVRGDPKRGAVAAGFSPAPREAACVAFTGAAGRCAANSMPQFMHFAAPACW